MKVIRFEVEMRLSTSEADEMQSIQRAKMKLLDVPGAASVIQVGPVLDWKQEQVPS